MDEVSGNSLALTIEDNDNSGLVTLGQYITKVGASNPEQYKDISLIVQTIVNDCKMLSNYLVTPEPLRWRTKMNGNWQDITQFANSVMVENLCQIESIFALVSSLNSEPIFVSQTGIYVIFITPLEGDASENIVTPLGTIFSIYRRTQLKKGQRIISRKKQILHRGVDVLVSALVVYGKATTLVIASSPNRVVEFCLDIAVGVFIMVNQNVRTPREGDVYYADEKFAPFWKKKVCQIIYARKLTIEGKQCEFRMLSSKAAMAYGIIKNGGLYVLPACMLNNTDSALLLFEANPITHLINAAGGLATTGIYSSLELIPESLYDRVPLFAGSKHEILFAIRTLNFERSVK